MVYALTLSYRGTGYAGWQRQPNAMAVQQVVEEALSDLLQESVSIAGASRTDAGVHARGQTAHLELGRTFPERGLIHGTNRRLPDDIRVMAAQRMPAGFHARKCAHSKEYSYRLIRARVLSPLEALFAVRIVDDLDVEAISRATASLCGRHDFSAFALSGGSHRQPCRRILAAEWQQSGDESCFCVEGDGFLRGMVRVLVGTLLEVGRGRRSIGEFERLLTGMPRAAAGPTAPGHGLTLERVNYLPPWEIPVP